MSKVKDNFGAAQRGAGEGSDDELTGHIYAERERYYENMKTMFPEGNVFGGFVGGKDNVISTRHELALLGDEDSFVHCLMMNTVTGSWNHVFMSGRDKNGQERQVHICFTRKADNLGGFGIPTVCSGEPNSSATSDVEFLTPDVQGKIRVYANEREFLSDEDSDKEAGKRFQRNLNAMGEHLGVYRDQFAYDENNLRFPEQILGLLKLTDKIFPDLGVIDIARRSFYFSIDQLGVLGEEDVQVHVKPEVTGLLGNTKVADDGLSTKSKGAAPSK